MSDASKRKQSPRGGGDAPPGKRSKGGTGGRWKTPYHRAKVAEKIEMGTALDVGDEGLWVTHVRGMKVKAMRELTEVCEEYAKEVHGLRPSAEEAEAEAETGAGGAGRKQDMAASIEAELEAIRRASSSRPQRRQTFTPVSVSLECVFFMKTMRPIEPDALARRICEDARRASWMGGGGEGDSVRRMRYLNRLTPVMDSDKASENGIERVARRVLSRWFALRHESQAEEEKGDDKEQRSQQESEAPTYAIRYNIRSHTALQSRAVINKIAGLVQPQHKVNLTSPDKVILVEIFQFHCGMSVVDGKAWERLKRYNIHELYRLAAEEHGQPDRPGSGRRAATR